MMVSRSELKSRARESLNGNYGATAGGTLTIAAIDILVYLLFFELSNAEWLTVLSYVIFSTLMSLLFAGLFRMCLMASRRQTPRLNDLFSCFSGHPDKMILIYMAILGIDAVSSAPMIIVLLLLKRNTAVIAYFTAHPYRYIIIGYGVSILWMVWLIAVNTRYAVSVFLYLDHPERNTRSFLEDSRKMMKGHCLGFFRLMLSFAGMYFLSILSFGIGFLWVLPYIITTSAEYYLNLPKAAENDT